MTESEEQTEGIVWINMSRQTKIKNELDLMVNRVKPWFIVHGSGFRVLFMVPFMVLFKVQCIVWCMV